MKVCTEKSLGNLLYGVGTVAEAQMPGQDQ